MAQRIISNITLFDQATQQVALGKSVETPTKGSSMFPFIVGGKDSIILVAPTEIKVGDIVLAKIQDRHYIVHRIITIESSRITLMGDGNVKGVEHCTPQQICAKVQYIVHKGRKVNCDTPKQLRRAQLWRKLLPLRRYILAIWRRTPFWPFKR